MCGAELQVGMQAAVGMLDNIVHIGTLLDLQANLRVAAGNSGAGCCHPGPPQVWPQAAGPVRLPVA